MFVVMLRWGGKSYAQHRCVECSVHCANGGKGNKPSPVQVAISELLLESPLLKGMWKPSWPSAFFDPPRADQGSGFRKV